MRQPNQTPLSSRRRMWKRIARDGLTIVMLLAAIGYTASLMRPIYAGRTPVVGDVLRSVAPKEEALPPAPEPPKLSGPIADSVALIEASPEFAEQKRRF